MLSNANGAEKEDAKMRGPNAGRRLPMVRWYNPVLLLIAGIRAALTTTIGRITDNRELQAALSPIEDDGTYGVFDYSNGHAASDQAGSASAQDGIWLDYVADLGDGYKPTFAVAEAVARECLDHGGAPTQRAKILVMGGDEVYPDPFNNAYEERLMAVYREACEKHGEFEADLFAIPGNHDWYDGLREFSDLFCTGGETYASQQEHTFGAWKTKQDRSYFAIELPGDWWLCGVDVQLDTRLNSSQLRYFEDVARHAMQTGAKVILCAATPNWATSLERPVKDPLLDQIARIFEPQGKSVRLILAGDIHHYSRYQPMDEGPVLITSGGGGAFLHPTHQLAQTTRINWDEQEREYCQEKTFPSASKSHQLTYRNLLFPLLNPEFSLLIGLIYTIMTWFLETRRQLVTNPLDTFMANMVGDYSTIPQALDNFFSAIPKSPEFAALVVGLHIGLLLFNGSGHWLVRHSLAILHSLAHFLALTTAFCLAALMCPMLPLGNVDPLISFAVFFTIVLVAGSLLGGLVFGSFLTLTLNIFGLQYNNAFSSLRIADYKNFMRLHIDRSGTLTVYPFGIERASTSISEPVPIEAPIVID
ncbi:MAG: metallophosphoesterase [Erythrobacter sp.]